MKTKKSGFRSHRLVKDNFVYFLHIPKTAGTTFTAILDSQFDLEQIYPDQIWQKLLHNMPINFSKYKLFRGHFGHSITQLLPRKPIYLTMLRNPFERTISYYDHMRLEPIRNNWVSEKFLENSQTISDIFKNPEKTKSFSNNQTRHIAVDLDIQYLLNQFSRDMKNQFFLEEYESFNTPTVNDRVLIKIAKDRLEKFVFIGLVERFEESMYLLYYTFALKPIRNLWKLMVAPNKTMQQELSPETIEAIKNANRLDDELYQFGEELFENRYSQMITNLKEKYFKKNFEKLSFREMMYELLEQHYETHFLDSREILSSIDFDFTRGMSGNGWYHREINLENDIVYRWTGPETLTIIDFPLSDKSDVKVQFRVIGEASHEILKSLELMVNGHQIDLRISHECEETPVFQGIVPTVFECMVPKAYLQNSNGIVHFAFVVKETINLHKINHLYDTRNIGLAFDRIKIIPYVNSAHDSDTVLKEKIGQYYWRYLRRKPDKIGFDHYYSQIKNEKISLNDLAKIFVESDEYKSMQPI